MQTTININSDFFSLFRGFKEISISISFFYRKQYKYKYIAVRYFVNFDYTYIHTTVNITNITQRCNQ